MDSRILQAQIRSEKGKNNSRRSRAEGLIPAVVYSHGESDSILINAKDFYSVFKGNISESVILTLKIDGKDDLDVFVKDYQKNPISDVVEHLDFYKVTAGEKINTIVQLEFTGAGSAAGVKMGGVFEQLEREVEVEVLPKELPQKLTTDVTKLEIGESIHLSDIIVPESLSFKLDDSHVVAHVIVPRAVVDEEEETGEIEESEADAESENENA